LDIRVVVGDVAKVRGDALVVNLFEGAKAPGGATGAVDAALGGAIRKLMQAGEATGKWGDQTLIHSLGKLSVERVLVMGLGKPDEFTLDRMRAVSAEAAKFLRKIGARKICSIVHGAGAGGFNPAQATQALVEGALLGLYRFMRYKREAENSKEIESLTIIERDREKLRAMGEAVRRGRIVAEAANAARDLVNEPGNTLTPRSWRGGRPPWPGAPASGARSWARGNCAAWGRALLGVARGARSLRDSLSWSTAVAGRAARTSAWWARGSHSIREGSPSSRRKTWRP
jgi:leucyl aminopeptidase